MLDLEKIIFILIRAASWVADNYVSGVDEFKRHVIKISIEGKNRLDTFLKDVSDLSYIA